MFLATFISALKNSTKIMPQHVPFTQFLFQPENSYQQHIENNIFNFIVLHIEF